MSIRYHALGLITAGGLLATALHAQPPGGAETPPEVNPQPVPAPSNPVAPFKTRTDRIPEVTEANAALEKALEKIAAAKGFDPAKTNQEFEILLKPGDTSLKDLRGIKFDPAKGFEPVYVSGYVPEEANGNPQFPGLRSSAGTAPAVEIAALRMQVEALEQKLATMEASHKKLVALVISQSGKTPGKP